MKSYFLLLIPLFFLSSCTQNAAPVTHYGVDKGAGSAGVHRVVEGDTLWSISNRYNLVMRDIAVVNDLAPPFTLEAGTRLKLPPPHEYKVKRGDTLYSVSRLFNVGSSQIATLNRLSPPYALKRGQILKLPSVAVEEAPVALVAAAPQAAPVEPIESEVLVAPGYSVQPGQKPQAPEQKPKTQPQPETRVAAVHPKEKINVQTPKRSSSKFLKPVDGKIVSGYGPKADGLHNDGINIAAARGTPVKVGDNGVVVYAGNGLKGSGNLVLVRHDNRWMTAYAHLDTIDVKNGATIMRGQKIGTVGSSGAVNSPQLHFEVRRGTEALNPVPYLGG